MSDYYPDLDAIKRNDVKLETLAQNVNLLIQDVRTVQAKLDAMENRLLLLLPYPWHPTTIDNPINPPPYGTLLGPVTCEVKSYAEKEYADMTIAELRKEQDKPIDKEAKP
mgnify:CR=1 FL=1